VTEDVRSRMIEFLPRLRRFAYTLTRNSDQADDLVQDTCERALARIELWKPGTKLESWMYQIARNLWVDRGRAARVRGASADLNSALNIAGSDGRTVTENRLMVSRVFECMERLTRDQQVLLALVCVEGLTYPEAAEILGIPVGTVMSRLSRARQAIGAAILDKSDAKHGAETSVGKRP
jgi:RNA polymerase sigma-70 factor, ECF subfamily